ncbi:MAG: carboxypeptidase-like regulatory domain-containing protein [Candidatus Poseidoniaceae archaeon]|jgi:hypothetical protein|nr:carboxypeptidase-like regulatory domain-containing protein [Candidatus Poseidoniaceae archaeon]MDP7000708.1 carboxypeptidase-like regulatory domain-containing protein [Candidatus Poseidoniaceae archaeon]
MGGERASRLQALRSRVNRRLAEAEEAEEEVEDLNEIVVSVAKQPSSRIQKIKQRRDQAAEMSFTRTIAMWCIIGGSILGLLTGSLLLSGNPSDILSSSLFDSPEHAAISGHALEAETGAGVGDVEITLMSLDKKTEYFNTQTDDNGFYRFKAVKVDVLLLVAEKEGYVTIERVFLPDLGGEDPLTMKQGDGVTKEGSEDDLLESNLEQVVALTTIIAVMTILFAFVGFFAAAEAQRGVKYRRTQYLCGIALFSRGLIFFGPLLILFGMALLAISKEQFADQIEID